jgi:hypothetical protein
MPGLGMACALIANVSNNATHKPLFREILNLLLQLVSLCLVTPAFLCIHTLLGSISLVRPFAVPKANTLDCQTITVLGECRNSLLHLVFVFTSVRGRNSVTTRY